MHKEVSAVYRRSNRRRKGNILVTRVDDALSPGVKLIALVSILGISAYLLFIPESTDLEPVTARQWTSGKPSQLAVPSPLLTPTDAVQHESQQAREPANPVGSFELIPGLPAALEKASPAQRATADKLLAFITSGEMSNIRDLSRDEVLSLSELLAAELGPDALAAAAESHFGLPAAQFLARGNAPEVFADLFEAVQTQANPSTPATVVFSDQVQPDGRVTGHVHVIPAGTRRVYAAFENAGALHGLNHLLAVWRKPSDDRMVFAEYEPVRVGSVYNYVWLELDEGWQTGFYQLDLFHPSRTTELLASRSFNVR